MGSRAAQAHRLVAKSKLTHLGWHVFKTAYPLHASQSEALVQQNILAESAPSCIVGSTPSKPNPSLQQKKRNIHNQLLSAIRPAWNLGWASLVWYNKTSSMYGMYLCHTLLCISFACVSELQVANSKKPPQKAVCRQPLWAASSCASH